VATPSIVTTLCVSLLAGLACVPAAAQGDRPTPAPPPAPEPVVEPVTEPPTEEEEAIEINEEIAEIEEEIAEEEIAAELGSEDDELIATEEVPEAEEETAEPVTWTTESIRSDRRPVKNESVVLAFKEVKLEELVEFIALETGKVVMPIGIKTSSRSPSSAEKFNIVADKPMPRLEALDFIFTYLRMNDIGIIERANVIFIGKLDKMIGQLGEMEVVPAGVSLADRGDRGTLIFKIFQVENTDAGQIKDDISSFFPEDWARIQEDDLSNQIMVLGDVGLCQQMETIIRDLDRKWLQPVIRTFRLQYADAAEIETNILQLFEQGGSSGSSRTSTTTRGNRNAQSRGGTRTAATTTSSEGVPEAELRLTVNQQQNTVTLQGEPRTIDQITELVENVWDLPRPEGTSRLFILKYTDPIKVKDLLTTVMGGGSSTSSASRGRTGGQAQGNRADATVGIAGVYQFEAFPDRNALLVLAKTVESFTFIQDMIEKIDQPTDAGLPEIITLKYADAVALAEELNILLAKSGGRVSLPRPDTGLSAEGFSGSDGINISGPEDSGTTGDLQFPWGNATNAEEQSPESSLIGKVRVMPIIRQNALAILAPPAYREPMRKLIEAFDQPRRQVLLSATVVEVDLGDALNLGMKLGAGQKANLGALVSGTAQLSMPAIQFLTNMLDGAPPGGAGAHHQVNTLTLGDFGLPIIIEALNSITNTRIIQEPRVFTADNEEAVFFAGQEYPIATGTVETSVGVANLSTTIEYKNIGVFLNVRPRITEEGAVDLSISLELSQAQGDVPVGSTRSEVFGRKQVTTHAILLDGQTIVLGGLLKELESIKRERIPLLADIPFIGQLFEYNDETLSRTELIAFITPTVVHRPADNYTNFNLADLKRLEAVSRPLAEQLKEGQMIIDLNVHERLRHTYTPLTGGNVPPPDQSATESEIDAFQPELIELTPHNEPNQ
jgi:type II secretion system protein D